MVESWQPYGDIRINKKTNNKAEAIQGFIL